MEQKVYMNGQKWNKMSDKEKETRYLPGYNNMYDKKNEHEQSRKQNKMCTKLAQHHLNDSRWNPIYCCRELESELNQDL